MKKSLISITVLLTAFVAALANAYFLFFKSNDVATTSPQATTDTNTSTQVTPSSSDETAEVAVEQVATGQYQDGTYTGAVTATNRGDYQVQVTISGGQMADVTIVQYPNDNPTSESINSQALPVYQAEALSNQSAEVNQISGASEAYKGFTGSLQDALNQAL